MYSLHNMVIRRSYFYLNLHQPEHFLTKLQFNDMLSASLPPCKAVQGSHSTLNAGQAGGVGVVFFGWSSPAVTVKFLVGFVDFGSADCRQHSHHSPTGLTAFLLAVP